MKIEETECSEKLTYKILTPTKYPEESIQIHNYFKNYHTPTCFDTIVSSSWSLWSIPCQVTRIFQMQLLVITTYYLNLSHCCMFRHYRVILTETVINAVPSYKSISNAAVGNYHVLPTAAFEILV